MNLQKSVFLGMLAAVSLAFLALIQDFLYPVFWAATLATLFHGVNERLVPRVRGRRSLAAALTLLIILFTVILPAAFVTSAVISEAAALYQRIQSGEIDVARLLDWAQQQLPLVNDLMERVGVTLEDVRTTLQSAAVWSTRALGSIAVTAGQSAMRFAAMFTIMLYLLFFFLRDGERIVEMIIHALPLDDESERRLLQRFAEVVRATIKGTLVIGIVQGTLGGRVFWMLGIDGAILWGVLMIILSLIPIVGAFLIWGPAAILLMIGGNYVGGIILLTFGVVVISMVDNLLRPLLVGRDTKMPDYLVLLATLGGLGLFGGSGIVIGPLIAALFLTMWIMFMEEFSTGSDQQ